jgi:hypothetical protein
VRCLALLHCAPALIIYGAAGVGEVACDAAVEKDITTEDDEVAEELLPEPVKEEAK